MVCVDYSDIASITVPYNRHHFKELMIVTSSKDTKTHKLADENNCRLFVTDSFYDDGADFNKWKALEQGLDALGRYGWLVIHDADVLWPQQVYMNRYLRKGFIYTPRRYIADPIPVVFPSEDRWCKFKLHPQDIEWAGYTQIFHSDDPHLGESPWHQIDWKHCGGADSFFQAKWPQHMKVRPDFRVLHLGPAGTNWCGRVTPDIVDGTVPSEATNRSANLNKYMTARSGKRGDARFAEERIAGG